MKQLILLFCMAVVFGLQCSKDDPPAPDPCASVQCLNGGTCVDGTCNCGPWYKGADCSQEVRTAFFGNYTGTLLSKNGAVTTSGLATVSITTSGNGVDYLKVDNSWNIRLSDASGVFTVPGSQTINGIAVTRGYGAFSGSQVILTFGGGNQDFTFYGSR